MKPLSWAGSALALALAIAPVLALVPGGETVHAQQRRQWKRGDTLPPEVLKGGPNVNDAAQHLRRPPSGYGWFALDGAFLLASLSSGLVLEVIEN